MSNSRYEIQEEIGKGGLGAVYKAFDSQLHRDVAMKRVLTTEHASQEEVDSAAKKLIAEAQTLSSLNHPNIVTVFDVGQDEKGGFVVMELLNGETLDDTVARGVLTQEDFIQVVHQTQEALIAAQAVKILHRDLKPTNVMVIWQPSGKFQTKILDFGLAKFSKSPSVQTMDQEDAVMGSIFFMAPEQFERAELDERTDLYQIGCVYYHALTGQYPFNGETAPQVMNAHLKNRVTPLHKLRPDLSEPICKWVMWLISREMEDRPVDSIAALAAFPKDPNVMPPALIAAVGEEEIPVATAVAGQTTGIQIVVPPPQAVPPSGLVNTITGSAPVLPSGGTGAVGTMTGPLTSPVQPTGMSSQNKILWLMIGIMGALTIGLGAFFLISKAKEKSQTERMATLAGALEPQGSEKDIDIAAAYLTNKEATAEQRANAKKVLERVDGPGIDAKLISLLGESDSSFLRMLICGALAERGIDDAVPSMMAAFRNAEKASQKSDILNSVRRVATEEHVDSMLDYLEGDHEPAVRKLFEEIVLAIYRKQKDINQFTDPLLGRVSRAEGVERQSLFRILGALGSYKTLNRLRSVYDSNDDMSYQIDAVVALLNWPNSSPIGLTNEIINTTDNKTLKKIAGIAYNRMTGIPGTTKLESRIWQWGTVLKRSADPREDQKIFGMIIDFPSEETLKFLKKYENTPKYGKVAKMAIAEIEKRIEEADVIESRGELKADVKVIRGDGAGYIPERRSLGYWTSSGTYFIWFFKVKEAGNYTIDVIQSDPGSKSSDLEVVIGNTILKGRSVNTNSYDEVAVAQIEGEVELKPGQVHSLVLRAKGVIQPQLPNVERILLKKQ